MECAILYSDDLVIAVIWSLHMECAFLYSDDLVVAHRMCYLILWSFGRCTWNVLFNTVMIWLLHMECAI